MANSGNITQPPQQPPAPPEQPPRPPEQPPPPQEPPDQNSSTGPDLFKLIAGGFAVLSGASALVGGFTGAIPRLLRNDYFWFDVAVGSALLAVGVVLIASVLKRPGDKDRPVAKGKVGLTLLGFAAFALATGVLIWGLQSSLQHSDQPRIGVSWKITKGEQPVATVSVKIDGLKVDDTLFIYVYPGTRIQTHSLSTEPPSGELSAFPLYRSQSGGDQDGNADTTFDVQVPAGYAALQIVASLNGPANCSGSRPTATVAQNVASSAPASPQAQASTAPLYPRPVTKQPTFSCVVAVAPVNGAVPSATPAVPTG
jgi:hypothetical protein